MNPFVVRKALPADAKRVAALCKQLGYDASVEEVKARIETFPNLQRGMVIVALKDDNVVGWIQTSVKTAIESGDIAEITGLVVDESCRGLGIGKILVGEAERWARESHFPNLRVRTNVVREETHRFYIKENFKELKRQTVFQKEII